VRSKSRVRVQRSLFLLALCICFALITAGCGTTNNNGSCDAQGGANKVNCIQQIQPSTSAASVQPTSSRGLGTGQPPSTVQPTTRPTVKHKPSLAYLTNLPVTAGGPFQGGLGDNINIGVAFIDGKKYSNSFYEAICINTPIDVSIPPGYSKIVGTVGYSDGSSNLDGATDLQIQATTDPPDNSNPLWIRLDLIPLNPRQGVAFSDSLPAGTTAIQLSATSDPCSTEIVWGNAAVQ
jgi:hypothetical protein